MHTSIHALALGADAHDFRLRDGLLPCRQRRRESRNDQMARPYGSGLDGPKNLSQITSREIRPMAALPDTTQRRRSHNLSFRGYYFFFFGL